MKNIPLCIDYWFDPKDPDGESLLMFGDDGGSLTIIRFSQPPNSLFKKDEVDSVQTLFWSNMDKHSEFALVQYNQVWYALLLSVKSKSKLFLFYPYIMPWVTITYCGS